eukprot:534219-Prorocentrum_minimum.AAC.1
MDEVALQLRRCARVLPHTGNTGGFFVALFTKHVHHEATPHHLAAESDPYPELEATDADPTGATEAADTDSTGATEAVSPNRSDGPRYEPTR